MTKEVTLTLTADSDDLAVVFGLVRKVVETVEKTEGIALKDVKFGQERPPTLHRGAGFNNGFDVIGQVASHVEKKLSDADRTRR